MRQGPAAAATSTTFVSVLARMLAKVLPLQYELGRPQGRRLLPRLPLPRLPHFASRPQPPAKKGERGMERDQEGIESSSVRLRVIVSD
jgi:hypothetical protein